MQDLATGEVADGPENAQAVKEELTTAYSQTRGPLELQRLNSLPVSGPLAACLIELGLSEGRPVWSGSDVLRGAFSPLFGPSCIKGVPVLVWFVHCLPQCFVSPS